MTLSGEPVAHDSAHRHVAGAALYIDDLPEPRGLLHAWLVLSPHAHARILRVDASLARASPGVACVLGASDVPGVNDVGPAFPGDPIFAPSTVEYAGQCVLAVAAETRAQARTAAAQVAIDYAPLDAVLTIEQALAQDSFVLPSRRMARGDAARALAAAPHRRSGTLRIGGQEHFYLEGQVAMAVPREDDLLVLSSTQHPTEVQHLAARALGVPDSAVTCEVRRMGGGFGGKESQASLIGVVAALLARRTGRPVKLRLDRDDDMRLTGKRHDFRVDYDVGFDASGRVLGLDLALASRCGMSPDLSGAVNDRAMLHADNAYWLPDVAVTSHRCRTNTVSNTAFRGFGGPQGMLAIEHVMEVVAEALDRDPLEVRRANFYGTAERNVTPYGMTIDDNVIADLTGTLAESAGYAARRQAVAAFNAAHRWVKRGIALTPLKFGISFTLLHLNQGGALVHVYTDGSVALNHGGTEMGQGLFVKVAQVVADVFGLPLDRVRLLATSTGKVPNTAPTAASSGTDLNAAAAARAAQAIRDRMAEVAAAAWDVPAATVRFEDGHVSSGAHRMGFGALAQRAHRARVPLSATGFYSTPGLSWDADAFQGRPFGYFAYGAAVSEVEVDTLTGDYVLRRADLLQDVGRSLNPAIDRGQIEGAFVQGMGWLTTEELWWDAAGRLRTHAPSTYKIPAASDVPQDFRVALYGPGENHADSVHGSKAVGEPPLMLAISVLAALRHAVAAVGHGPVALDAPATPERVLMEIERRRAVAELRMAAE